jgi:hypothetical protein
MKHGIEWCARYLGHGDGPETALNVGYMAEMLSIFSIVVGVALLLAGIGFVILALARLPKIDARRGGRSASAGPGGSRLELVT